ncbi:hypothetical protein COS44_00200 [bacterium (Candidatus Gribaldobacteria) CG03_land_8_20_14_0_80_36_40]|uniref:Serine protease n=1 Tax=bacterium (Candidatus Gribaldobacteria) CG03_land_8_20_14_0_80_36_40 TaxID=2014271 RepID=A0A2M7BZP6_9BACT|nr:MAG: hypothetical protein COS44_00200 [bacterium (Candidatus Gribaldobacteria) CG03_land_8_20_14_0_80_36_40]
MPQETEKQKEFTPKERRVELIKKLEEARGGTNIISYVVSTRGNAAYQMADDAVRLIYDHLKGLGKQGVIKIDLFLHSFGGVGVVPWKLTSLIREFTSDFEILIPYKAYSAATLTALGANRIWMHPMGELGPVDPKVANEFNPPDGKGNPIGINVEDVASYVSFVKDAVGIKHEDELVQAFAILANKVHPLALGNIHRFYSQSRMIAKKLLRLHMKRGEEHTIEEIVDALTAKLFFHGHPINRKEAKGLKLKINNPPKKVEDLMWQLYEEYEKEMEIKNPFNPVEILNTANQDSLDSDVRGAYVESKIDTDVFISHYKIWRPSLSPLPPNASPEQTLQRQQFDVQRLGQANVTILKQGWEKE